MVGLLSALVTDRDLEALFRPEMIRAPVFEWMPRLQPEHASIYTGLWLAAGLLFIAGVRTRLSGSLIVAAIVVRFVQDWNLYWTAIYLCGLLTLLLTLGDCGKAYSWDWLRAAKPAATVPRWPGHLVRAQISIVYFFTALEKVNPIVLSGLSFLRAVPPIAAVGSLELARAAAVATIAFEFWIAFTLWSKRFQHWAFFLGWAFHTGILVCIGPYAALLSYSTMFVGFYLLFLDVRPGEREVFYDQQNPAQRKLASWLRRLDWLGAHRFSPGGAELRLKTPAGELSGAKALQGVLKTLPLTFLFAALLDLKPLRALVWKRVA